MAIRDLMPSLWKKSEVPVRREAESPFFALQSEMNRLFDEFFRGFEPMPFRRLGERPGAFRPSVDVVETDKEIVVKAELPGMEEKDMEVLVSDDALTITGEKKDEREEQGKEYYHLERTYGSFRRVIPLPEAVDRDKIACRFKNGVLTVSVPKTEAVPRAQKVPIKAE